MRHIDYRNWLGGALLAAALLAGSGARAQVNMNEPDPSVWLKSVYDLYQRAETNTKLMREANYRLIVKRAAKPLAALFRRNDACEKKSGGICALDWDLIVNGQDSQLTDISVGAAAITGDKATVTATFKNMGAENRNTYFFVRENGVWKVEDVETRTGKEAPLRIARLLRDHKP
ncbi:MAG: DUF3828 domain-containing protein [Rhizobiales bacterium]|nr:DUF3828 domain-containing protein [Hyphomicrobiales bacterium]